MKDTRDKTELVDAVTEKLMQDYREGDETLTVLLNDYLTSMSWDWLKAKLPEDQREEFDAVKAETNVQDDCLSIDLTTVRDKEYRQGLIAKVMTDYYGDHSPMTGTHQTRLQYLGLQENYKLRNMLREAHESDK